MMPALGKAEIAIAVSAFRVSVASVRRRLRLHLLLAGAVSILIVGCGDKDRAVDRVAAQPRTSKRADPPQPSRRDGSDLVNALLPHQQTHETQVRPLREGDWFEDVTAASGLAFAYRDGSEAGFYELIETIGGGVALLDYNRDGLLDVFLTGGGSLVGPPIEIVGRRCALFRNEGNWHFSDVTEQAQLADAGLYTHGASVADFDADGFADLLVAGYEGLRLYRNRHDGTFADVTADTGINSPVWNVTAAFGDVDRDGLTDLYLVTYADAPPDHRRRCPNDQNLRDACGPTLFEGVRDSLWHSLGDGTFADVSDAAQLELRHRGLGVVSLDLNEDGWLDYFVVNDVNENELYIGGPEFSLREIAQFAGAAYSATGEREGSMGVDVGDFDGDGAPDLFYANFSLQDNTLLRKVSPEGFLNVTTVSGLAGVSRQWVGFGTGFVDFDSDGWLDLFVNNGHVNYQRRDAPYFQPAQLFRNENGRRYAEVTEVGGPYFSVPHAGRGAAAGDIDNDGATDLIVSHQNDPVALLRNRLPAPHWLRVELVGTTSERDAIGAKVTIPHGDRVLTRWIRGGGGYLSVFDPRILVPLAHDEPTDVTVGWPSGLVERFPSLQPNRNHVLVEGRGQPTGEEPSRSTAAIEASP